MNFFKWLIPIFIALIAVGAFFSLHSKCNAFSCLNFAGKSGYREVEVYENTSKSYRSLLQSGDMRLRMEMYSDISPKEASNFNQIKTMELASLYQNTKSPYPGALSNEIECGQEYRPKTETATRDGITIEYSSAFLNNRLQYGVCMPDQIAYAGNIAMMYCPNQRKWYYAEAISKASASDVGRSLVRSIRCSE